jgi:hypothetical protein
MELYEELRNYAENVEHTKRTCIENFNLDNIGKNRASSFAITREPKASKGVCRLLDKGGDHG